MPFDILKKSKRLWFQQSPLTRSSSLYSALDYVTIAWQLKALTAPQVKLHQLAADFTTVGCQVISLSSPATVCTVFVFYVNIRWSPAVMDLEMTEAALLFHIWNVINCGFLYVLVVVYLSDAATVLPSCGVMPEPRDVWNTSFGCRIQTCLSRTASWSYLF